MAVFATRKFKKGEEINLCRGGVADLTEEEDDQLRRGGQKADFSVLYSSRKKSFGLLLGPARFVNVSRLAMAHSGSEVRPESIKRGAERLGPRG